jgi:hypothetical protein
VVKIGFQLFIFLVKHNLAAEYRTYTGVAVIHSIIKNKTPTQITRSFATFLPRVHIHQRRKCKSCVSLKMPAGSSVGG